MHTGVPNERIRVLQIVQNLNYGGMERLLADIVRRASADRFESHVLCLGYFGHFAEGLEHLAELHLASPLPQYTMIWPRPLMKQIAEIRPDVVHTHGGVWYKASLAARHVRVPLLVHTEHGRQIPDPWANRLIDRMAARRTDVVVAVSESLIRTLERNLAIDRRRIRFVPNGVDTALFRPTPDNGHIRRELGIPPDAAIIGSVGRLEPVKGYDVMIAALAELHSSWTNGTKPVLVVGGDGSERARLMSLIAAHALEDHVHLLGWRDDVADLHAAFTLFTMASHSEGTSVSLLEAMSAGLCPVVTDVGGNPGVLGTRLRPMLVPPKDPRSLAAAWGTLLHDAQSLREYGAAARQRVQETFSLDAMVAEYERIYASGKAEVSGAPS